HPSGNPRSPALPALHAPGPAPRGLVSAPCRPGSRLLPACPQSSDIVTQKSRQPFKDSAWRTPMRHSPWCLFWCMFGSDFPALPCSVTRSDDAIYMMIINILCSSLRHGAGPCNVTLKGLRISRPEVRILPGAPFNPLKIKRLHGGAQMILLSIRGSCFRAFFDLFHSIRSRCAQRRDEPNAKTLA